MSNPEIKNKSIEKAVKVLNCFIDKPTLGVTEISEKLDLYKSNVHNIITTLKNLEYVEQDPETDKYRLGLGIFRLSRALGDSFSITKIAIPFMQELANISNERVYLGVPNKDEVLYLESLYPVESINLMRSLLGEKAKMYCTGIGKAMMAFLPDNLIHEYASADLEGFTENTITDRDKLIKELMLIRVQGYALDNMEHEFGIKCVAAPVLDRSNSVIAGISISGPSLRFGEERVQELVELLKKYVKKIEQRV